MQDGILPPVANRRWSGRVNNPPQANSLPHRLNQTRCSGKLSGIGLQAVNPLRQPEGCRSRSIKQVLLPAIVTLCEQAHQVPAGVQTERTRRARQLHPGLLGRTATLAIIAGMTACDEVLPGGFTRPRSE